ncbi:MAG TPA: phosphatase PAP2 family protein [Polyangiaceae bacterium]
MRLRGALCVAIALFAASHPAKAQDSGSENRPKPATQEDPTEEERAKLVKEILTTGEEADDLTWLYSHADEYAPSRLTGEPIPAPGLPERGEGAPRSWDPRWRKFGVANYVLTGAAVGISAASSFVPVTHPWRKTNSLDEWGRRTIGVDTYAEGQWAQDTSDILLSINIAFPLLVDSLVTSYWYRRSPEVAGQTALIAVEAMAVASMLQGATTALTQRERPYGRDCGDSVSARLPECTDNVRYRSFFSGHTTMSFAAATVTCGNHARFELFADGTADTVTCVTALGSATAVGMLRIVALKHYVTDVAAGAAIGSLSGLGVPWLLHYGPLARVEADSKAGFTWSVYPLQNGLAVKGAF